MPGQSNMESQEHDFDIHIDIPFSLKAWKPGRTRFLHNRIYAQSPWFLPIRNQIQISVRSSCSRWSLWLAYLLVNAVNRETTFLRPGCGRSLPPRQILCKPRLELLETYLYDRDSTNNLSKMTSTRAVSCLYSRLGWHAEKTLRPA